ncbi:hypothetical protein WJX74_008866 [Apatococcus lobatus]|uniref:VASt domain-containing protein n=1 Tax=Apatococcus lobatus TaxID=904363 RepID=A0AAW1R1E1_9CHLO
MNLASTEPSLRLEDYTHSYQPQFIRHNPADSAGAESFTFDNANGPPQPEGAVSPVIVRAGRIDEHAAAPQGPPELERHSGQDVSPASSMTGSFTADKEEGLSIRAQRKNQELRDLFKLPSDEAILDDFRCAIKRRILHQGHLYVFDRHVCFHSNVFGYVRSTVMPLKDVSAVKKQKALGLPNSLEITCDGKTSFFTSFLSREDAYRLITRLWVEQNPDAQEYLARVSTGDASRRQTAPGDMDTSEHQVTSRELSETSDMSEDCSGREGRRFLMKTATGTHLHPVPKGDHPAHPSGANSQHTLMPASEGNPRDPMQRTSMLTTPQGGVAIVQAAGMVPENGSAPEGPGDSPAAGQAQSNFNSDSEYGDDGDLDFAENTPAPAVPNDWVKLVEGDLKCSSRSFYQRFLSDEVNFYTKWHKGRGDQQVIMQKWGKHPHHGRVRDLQFQVKIKGYGMGPSQAVCHQVQRVRMYKGDHLVFETSQVMDDIPYGDRFKVEARWDVTSQGPDACQVTTRVSVPWSKAPMGIIKRQVEKGVTDSCRESHKDWMDKAEQTLAEQPSGSPQSARAPSSNPSASHMQPPAKAAPGRRRGGSDATSSARSKTPSPFKSQDAPGFDAGPQGGRSGDTERHQMRRFASRKASTRSSSNIEEPTFIFGFTQQQCLLAFLGLILFLQLWSIMVLHGRSRDAGIGTRLDKLMQAVQQSSGSGSTITQLQTAVTALQTRVDTLTADLARLASQCQSKH